jgi:hypothetical protein
MLIRYEALASHAIAFASSRQGQQRSLRRMRQDLSWALGAFSRGAQPGMRAVGPSLCEKGVRAFGLSPGPGAVMRVLTHGFAEDASSQASTYLHHRVTGRKARPDARKAEVG